MTIPSTHIRFTLVFATGRCGTAMLAQYFGCVARSRQDWRQSGDNLVAHEPFDQLDEYWQEVAAAKQGKSTNLVERILLPSIEKWGRIRNCFISDNKIGRLFFDEFRRAGLPTQLIYLHRNPDDVIASMKNRSPKPEDLHWCYEKNDAGRIALGDDPYRLHVAETEFRWKRLRKKLGVKDFLEVAFEEFVSLRSVRHTVEQFVGMPGMEQLVNRKTNASATNFQM